MELTEELVERGFINQSSADLDEIFNGEKRTIYFGVDPTAESIHAGNFVGYMLLRHLAKHGHNIIMLAGGATGRIGDPKPDVERPLLPEEEITRRVELLQKQAVSLLNLPDLEVVNNYDWFKDISLLDFLRDIGKHFTVGELIKKEAIARRLESDIGLSYTEFAYPLIQGYDFLELFRTRGCDMQIGGSDQWGNILAGVDLVRRKEHTTVYGLTLPLVIDKATGKKFGKSEGNAVWLASEKTSPYEFYQFWFNASDESVIDYLKLFTLVSLENIAQIETEHRTDSANRIAQKRLAFEVTEMVHGKESAQSAKEVSEVLFGGTIDALSQSGRDLLVATAPTQLVKINMSILDVLVESKLASSKREARTFIESGAITLGSKKISDTSTVIEGKYFSHDCSVLRRGKKHLCILILS